MKNMIRLLTNQEGLSAMYHQLKLHQPSPRSMEMVQDISELFLQPWAQLEDRHCNYHWAHLISPLWQVQCTHRLRAVLTHNSKFPLCTAKSINATTSSFSAAAVFSIRPLQWLSCEFMSVKQVHQHADPVYTFEPHFLSAHIWHHYQADASSALETASLPLRIHCLSICLGRRIHPFRHWRGTGRIWWTMRWQELQNCALNTVINARDDGPFGSEHMLS